MSPKEFAASHNAGRHLALYARTEDGALLWKARAEFRSRGLPVPDALENEFDQIGKRLLAASKASEITTALGIGKPALRMQQEAARDIVEFMFHQRKRGHPPEATLKQAAEKFGRTYEAVKSLWRDWEKKPSPERTLLEEHWHPNPSKS